MPISNASWDGSASRFTPEEWHRSCLIHLHTGAPDSKDQCKLPVREPGGALNRSAVHAAAAALAGARGGVDAPPAQKAAAARALVRLYGELDELAPPSVSKLANLQANRAIRRAAGR